MSTFPPSLLQMIVVSVAISILLQQNRISAMGALSALTMAFFIFLLLAVARIVWAWLLYPRYQSPLRHIPKPPDKPSLFMGHFFQMIKAGPGMTLRSWANAMPKQDFIRYLDIFNQERLAVLSPPALADILVHRCYDFEKPPPMRKGLGRILGLGLFLAEGEVHKEQRKQLMPAFAFRHVKNLYPVFWDISQDLIAAISASEHHMLSTNTNGNICVEVNAWACRATLDIIGQAGFGQSFNAIKEPDNELSQTYHNILSTGRGRLLGVLGLLLPHVIVRRLPFLRNDRIKQGSEFIRAFCHSSIEAKRRELKIRPEDTRDILTVAMGSNAFSDEELVNQMMTFLVAGHETTASAFTWAIYILAKHRDIQDRLREEVHDSIPHPINGEPQSITAEDFEKMSYLNAICRETLRLFPPVAMTIRVAVRDTSICGQPIPKGTTVIIPPWTINGSSALWGEDATEFVPERWLRSSEDAKGTNYNYMTFLHGPRSCIGQSFAMGEFLCLVAAWVAAFDTELQDEDFVPVIKGGITAKPRGGVHVRLRPIVVG